MSMAKLRLHPSLFLYKIKKTAIHNVATLHNWQVAANAKRKKQEAADPKAFEVSD